MQGHQYSRTTSSRLRSGLAGLLLGGAASCLLAAPASAQGYASPVNWSGPWASIGIGAVTMDTDTKISTYRRERTDIEIACEPRIFGATEATESKENLELSKELLGICSPISWVNNDQVNNLVLPDLPVPDGGFSINASIFPLLQQQLLNLDGLSDAGVMGVLSAGWDQRLSGSNFLIGAFFDFDFYNVSADFSSQVTVQGGSPSIDFDGLGNCIPPICETSQQGLVGGGDELIAGIIGGIIGASILNDLRDEQITIDGKIEQDYAIAVGGKLGYIWNEVFMTYFGAAWTRTSIDGHVNVNISDPFCSSGSICSSLNSPTSIRLDLDEDVDGYKLLIGGEYALGQAVGGSWFLRGQAEYADYDGISAAFDSSRKQQIFSFEGPRFFPLSVDIARQINEQATVSISKEDYAAHTSLVYKFGGGS